jgi:hypothetical protein
MPCLGVEKSLELSCMADTIKEEMTNEEIWFRRLRRRIQKLLHGGSTGLVTAKRDLCIPYRLYSSGNNIALDYLLWDQEKEVLPPVLTRTMRLSAGDIFHVFKNFLGLRPPLLPNGSHLFTVDKDSCRKSRGPAQKPRRRALGHLHYQSDKT